MTTGQRVVLIILALSVIAAITTGGTIYYRLMYFFGLLYFGGWLWSKLSLKGIRFQRSARTLRAQVGQIFEERFEIENDSILPRIWIEIRDESPLPGTEGSRVLTMIERHGSRSYLARTRLIRRGVFPLGPTVLASGDIFGLFPANDRITADESLLVYPLMFEIQSFPLPSGLLSGGEALRRRTHQITPNASGVRDYAPGDPLNRIHWVSTARRRRLMVKEFELDPLADVWIFLDAAEVEQSSLSDTVVGANIVDIWHASKQIQLSPSTEEYGVSIAASLARNFLRRSRAVGLVAAGQHVTLLSPDRGGRQLGKILEALALLKAVGVIPLRGLVETQVKHMTRGSTVILITPSVQLQIAIIVDYLVQRGMRPIIVLLDAESFGGLYGSDDLAFKVRSLGVPVRIVRNGDDLSTSLSEQTLYKPIPEVIL
jgi:uncharacterized protein (DUF58 family)